MLCVLIVIVSENGRGDRNIILVDSSIGSKHYATLLGESAVTIKLESADFAFSGNGKTIGIEIKRISDAIQCFHTGRLADEQIPKMRVHYDISYLVVEGIYRSDPTTGVLQVWKEFDSSKEVKCGRWIDATAGPKRLTFSTFEQWLNTMSVFGGVSIRASSGPETTAALVLALFAWFNRESHASYDVMHQAQGNGAALSRPTMLRRMLALLPHVGWERSARLQSKISGVRFMAKTGQTMKASDWFIPGEIAEKSAEDIDRACDGESDS